MSFDPTFQAVLEKQVSLRGDAIAIVTGEKQISYRDLHAQILRAAQGYNVMGLAPRERIAILLESSIEAVIAIFGAWSAGLIAVPIHVRLKPHQIAHILSDCLPKVIVTSPWRLQELQANLSLTALRVVTCLDDLGSDTRLVFHRSIDVDAAAILYTSGSTGQPKGVVISHRNLTSGAASVADYLDIAMDDVILAALPLSFDAGLSQLTTGFMVGAKVVLHTFLQPNDLAATCARNAVTAITAVPPLWRQIVEAEWTSEARQDIRRVASTGGHVPGPLLNRLRATFPFARPFLMYGLTEAFRSTYLDPSCVDEKPGSIGKAIPNNEILVLDEDGQPCSPGGIGELVHRGSTVALGYWNRPEETAAVFKPLPGRQSGLVPEYAVWSGDLVHLDDEGYLYIHGRRDELIKSSGYRISPGEIEAVIARAPSVVESAVFGYNDVNLGQHIVCALVLAGGGSLIEVGAFARHELPGYMYPVLWELPELPRLTNGKIDRQLLRSRYADSVS